MEIKFRNWKEKWKNKPFSKFVFFYLFVSYSLFPSCIVVLVPSLEEIDENKVSLDVVLKKEKPYVFAFKVG